MKEDMFGIPPKREREPLTQAEIERITDEGVRRAQEIARAKGFEVGQHVSFPQKDRQERIYAVKEVLKDEGELVAWFPGQEDTIRRFPIDGSYDPRIAANEAHTVLAHVRMGGDPRQTN